MHGLTMIPACSLDHVEHVFQSQLVILILSFNFSLPKAQDNMVGEIDPEIYISQEGIF